MKKKRIGTHVLIMSIANIYCARLKAKCLIWTQLYKAPDEPVRKVGGSGPF